MANVKFNNISKHFGTFTAVKNFDLEIKDQEFLVLVGPSGCGKTTSLRMLAGLEEISEGTIQIGDRTINEEPAKARDIAMVFQSYALYPHWTIYDNLAFGLRTRKLNLLQKSIITGLQTLFYVAILGIYLAISIIIDLIVNGLGVLIFSAGVFGGIATLAFFSEVRTDIRDMNVRFAAKFFEPIDEYAKIEKEIAENVYATSRMLGIEEQLYKKPKQLSGGQRQRVALGRAIIRDPQVFLMDEPLSNLDAKLRVQMRAELQRLQKKLKTTTIYVTHDQIEAMTLADRIAIMNEGILQQVGAPDEVYSYPVNKFVAGFIGSPSMNFIDGRMIEQGGKLIFESFSFRFAVPERYKASLKEYIGNKEIWLGIRPEHITLTKIENGSIKSSAKIGVLEPIGSDTFVYVDFPRELSVVVKIEGAAPFKLDQSISVTFDSNQVHFFDRDTEKRFIPDIVTTKEPNVTIEIRPKTAVEIEPEEIEE
ncbi:MAG: ABC transporter ATP-binding protein [Candidatus Hodarchaeales archaeon]|jgi:multiple sugar transport system ATP-binding protein